MGRASATLSRNSSSSGGSSSRAPISAPIFPRAADRITTKQRESRRAWKIAPFPQRAEAFGALRVYIIYALHIRKFRRYVTARADAFETVMRLVYTPTRLVPRRRGGGWWLVIRGRPKLPKGEPKTPALGGKPGRGGGEIFSIVPAGDGAMSRRARFTFHRVLLEMDTHPCFFMNKQDLQFGCYTCYIRREG